VVDGLGGANSTLGKSDDERAPRTIERIPAERYFSRAYMEREWDRMWTRVWLLGAHVSALPQVGSFRAVEIGRESVLLVRQTDGRVRAFYNVCQHRGNRLCGAESGEAQSFRCAYHHWQWRADGSLLRMHRPEGFGDVGPPDELKLAEIACEERCGFVWISMAERPEPIDDYLAEVAPLVTAYGAERFHPVADTTCEIACNWKLSADVSNEGYHVAPLHPELLRILDERGSTLEILGRHSHIVVPTGIPTSEAERAAPPSAALRDYMTYVGVDVAAFRGTAADARPAMQRAIRARAEAEGVDLARLPDAQLTDKHQFYVFPNVQLNFSPRRLEVYRHRPHPTDPTITYFDEQAFELGPPRARPAPPKHVRFRAGEQSMGPVMGADVALLPGLQRGMESRGFRGLLLGAEEGAIRQMHRTLDGYLGEGE
jgi:phenylpropionate dioxygenase-like ring-hydroxylating dioxygenase large terminal subunit